MYIQASIYRYSKCKKKISSTKFHCLLNLTNIQSNCINSGDMFVILSLCQIPVPFLIMLVTQFILIVIDRALYLRKNILGKFIFQILLVILIHVWLFFVLPYVTKRSATPSTHSLSLSLCGIPSDSFQQYILSCSFYFHLFSTFTWLLKLLSTFILFLIFWNVKTMHVDMV